MKIYRYREASNYNIEYLANNAVNGSLFATFKDVGELNIDISDFISRKYEYTEEGKKQLISSFLDNIKHNYYLACFTFNSPYDNNLMWKKYANNGNGFCLEYDYNELLSTAFMKRMSTPIFFEKVEYKKEPFLIDKIIKEMISCGPFEGDINDEKIEKISKILAPKIGDVVIRVFLNKKYDFLNEREVRIVLQGNTKYSSKNDIYNPCIISCKPKKIIISNKVNTFDRERIISIAIKNNVEYKIIKLQ